MLRGDNVGTGGSTPAASRIRSQLLASSKEGPKRGMPAGTHIESPKGHSNQHIQELIRLRQCLDELECQLKEREAELDRANRMLLEEKTRAQEREDFMTSELEGLRRVLRDREMCQRHEEKEEREDAVMIDRDNEDFQLAVAQLESATFGDSFPESVDPIKLAPLASSNGGNMFGNRVASWLLRTGISTLDVPSVASKNTPTSSRVLTPQKLHEENELKAVPASMLSSPQTKCLVTEGSPPQGVIHNTISGSNLMTKSTAFPGTESTAFPGMQEPPLDDIRELVPLPALSSSPSRGRGTSLQMDDDNDDGVSCAASSGTEDSGFGDTGDDHHKEIMALVSSQPGAVFYGSARDLYIMLLQEVLDLRNELSSVRYAQV